MRNLRTIVARASVTVAALVAVASAGCSGDEPVASQSATAHSPWRQTDLWSLATDSERTQYGTRQSRAIRALSQEPGTPLHFSLELADSAELSFRGLVEPGHACVFSVSLAARKGKGKGSEAAPQLLYEQMHIPRGSTLSPVVTVDLSPFAFQKVDLFLDSAPANGVACSPLWGSPRVIDRHGGLGVRGVAASAPNVLFLTADTLRADALGAWGREPSASPALDRFASRSDVWLEAFSSINNTNPSFASLMTGLYVKNHRVYDLTTALPDSHTTLAEIVHEAGYATRAVVSAAHLGRAGLRQGFDQFTQPGGQFFAETVVDMGIEWLQQGGEQPFFLWLHFFDAHTPHNPPSPFARGEGPTELTGMAGVKNWAPFREGGRPRVLRGRRDPATGNPRLYASEVAYLDRQLDRLFDFVESAGLGENTIIVVVADHGETLGERQSFYNHAGLYDETTHVPLMIHWPKQTEGRRVKGLVQHFDVFPTLLAALGLTVPEMDGIDLRSVEPGVSARETVFANHANNRGEMVRTDDHLYLVNRKVAGLKNGPHFYAFEDDPAARADLLGKGRPEEVTLRKRLRAWNADRRDVVQPKRREIGSAERAQLEALGYLDERE